MINKIIKLFSIEFNEKELIDYLNKDNIYWKKIENLDNGMYKLIVYEVT